jgi:hypothetical protein
MRQADRISKLKASFAEIEANLAKLKIKQLSIIPQSSTVDSSQQSWREVILSYVKTIQPNMTWEKLMNSCRCPYCEKTFTKPVGLFRHVRFKICMKPKETKKSLIKSLQDRSETLYQIKRQLDQIEMDIQLDNLETEREQAIINDETLPQKSLDPNDDLFDILHDNWEILDIAGYLKMCILNEFKGDCDLLDEAYKLNTPQSALICANKERSKYKYISLNGKERQETEVGADVMGQILANILKRSYMSGLEKFILVRTGQSYLDGDKVPYLDDSDMLIVKGHMSQLDNICYVRKLLSHVNEKATH